jgi:hypothetical protein
MAIKFLREIVVSSLATALVTVVYTHGPELAGIGAPRAATAATPASPEGKDQRPEGLAQFMARVASAHVGRSSPPSPVREAPAAAAADPEPVWPTPLNNAGKSARATASAKPAAAKPALPSVADGATEIKSAPEPAAGAPPAQAEAAPPASYTAHIVDRFKDYVWNPSASVVNGVTNGVSAVTNRISSFVKRQPS